MFKPQEDQAPAILEALKNKIRAELQELNRSAQGKDLEILTARKNVLEAGLKYIDTGDDKIFLKAKIDNPLYVERRGQGVKGYQVAKLFMGKGRTEELVKEIEAKEDLISNYHIARRQEVRAKDDYELDLESSLGAMISHAVVFSEEKEQPQDALSSKIQEFKKLRTNNPDLWEKTLKEHTARLDSNTLTAVTKALMQEALTTIEADGAILRTSGPILPILYRACLEKMDVDLSDTSKDLPDELNELHALIKQSLLIGNPAYEKDTAKLDRATANIVEFSWKTADEKYQMMQQGKKPEASSEEVAFIKAGIDSLDSPDAAAAPRPN